MARKVLLSPTPWHPGYPFRARGGKARRVLSAVALASMLTLIGGYQYVTDSSRVRRLAEKYLTEVVGGPVRVGRARLSFFEGLRLDQVTLSVDRQGRPDSRLMQAESLHVSFSIPKLLRGGDLADVDIVAVAPQVLLVSDETGNAWNFERLRRPAPTTSRPTEEPVRRSLPRVTLRNARLAYAELQGGKLIPRGTYTVEGVLAPDTGRSERYNFAVSARGQSDLPGPSLTGSANLSTGEVTLSVVKLDLGPDVERMLPGPVREWWQRHEIAGTFDIPEFSIEPLPKPPDSTTATTNPSTAVATAQQKQPRRFRVVVRFEGGAMSLRPEELRLPSAPPVPPGMPAIRFSNVRGEVVFTEAGITLRDFSLLHEGNTLRVNGTLSGYNLDAPLALTVACDNLTLGQSPSFVPSLPPEPREVYDRFKPEGEGAFSFNIARAEGGEFSIDGRIDIHKGRSTFERFPFTCHDVTGAIIVRPVSPGQTELLVQNIRGRGKAGGVNADADLRVDGRMFPLEGGSEVDFTVRGTNVDAEDELVAAMPADVRKALSTFDPDRKKYPQFGGNFECHVYRYPGKVSRWLWPIDITLHHGQGRFEPFPYPLEKLTGQVLIRSGYTELKDFRAQRTLPAPPPSANPASNPSILVNGKLFYGDEIGAGELKYDLTLAANNVPLDDTLRQAVPAEKREWITRLGLTGTLTATGTVTGTRAAYDLALKLTDGQAKPLPVDLWTTTTTPAPLAPQPASPPPATPWTLTDLEADFRLTPTRFTVISATGRRQDSSVSATGLVELAAGEPAITFDLSATALPLDADLRAILPAGARAGWDSVRPEGQADVLLQLRPGHPQRVEIMPRAVAATPTFLPVRVEGVTGKVTVDGDDITLTDLRARRGTAAITLAGTGSTAPAGEWNVELSSLDTDFDPELRAALPAMLRDTLTSLDVRGKADVHLRRLRYAPGPGPRLTPSTTPTIAFASPAPTPSDAVPAADITRTAAPALLAPLRPIAPSPQPTTTASSSPGVDVDFDVQIIPRDLTLSLGVPLRLDAGRIELQGQIRNDLLGSASGSFLIASADAAGRTVRNLSASLEKSEGQPGFRLSNLAATFCDGDLAGQAAVAFPTGEPTRYAMELVLRNADVRQLGGKQTEQMSGRLSASLSLEGSVSGAGSRRGRGDVTVTGDQMARVPVLLGLVQVANLSLPGNTSFNNASARYSLDGPRVTLEQIAIRSPGLEMIGNGRIDLDQRDVRLTFWSAAPDLPKVPLFSDLADRARRELLQIQVRGKIDDPKFSASSLDSFSTTIDEVFRSSGRNSTTRK